MRFVVYIVLFLRVAGVNVGSSFEQFVGHDFVSVDGNVHLVVLVFRLVYLVGLYLSQRNLHPDLLALISHQTLYIIRFDCPGLYQIFVHLTLGLFAEGFHFRSMHRRDFRLNLCRVLDSLVAPASPASDVGAVVVRAYSRLRGPPPPRTSI